MNRVDAERTIVLQVKTAYAQVAEAVLALKFAREVANTNVKTLDLFQTRFHSGAINEGDLARIQTQKLESDQALDQAGMKRCGRRASRSRFSSVSAARCPTSTSTPRSSTLRRPARGARVQRARGT